MALLHTTAAWSIQHVHNTEYCTQKLRVMRVNGEDGEQGTSRRHHRRQFCTPLLLSAPLILISQTMPNRYLRILQAQGTPIGMPHHVNLPRIYILSDPCPLRDWVAQWVNVADAEVTTVILPHMSSSFVILRTQEELAAYSLTQCFSTPADLLSSSFFHHCHPGQEYRAAG